MANAMSWQAGDPYGYVAKEWGRDAAARPRATAAARAGECKLPSSRMFEWHALATCASVGMDPFFPPAKSATKRERRYDSARRVCDACPVWLECRYFGLGEAHGMWGGLTPVERRTVRVEAGLSVAQCGASKDSLDGLRADLYETYSRAGYDVDAALAGTPRLAAHPAMMDPEWTARDRRKGGIAA